MLTKAAGILLFRRDPLKVLLVHPGGPFNRGNHEHVWSIPKGEIDKGETNKETAIRELKEETGVDLSFYNLDSFIDLGFIKQNKNKRVHIFALEYNKEIYPHKSNICTIKIKDKEHTFREVDDMQWFTPDELEKLIIRKQQEFIDRLKIYLNDNSTIR